MSAKRDVTKQAITDVNSFVSRRNYDILTSIIAQLLTSRPSSDSQSKISVRSGQRLGMLL